MIAVDSELEPEQVEQIKNGVRVMIGFTGRRDAVNYYGAGVGKAENVGVNTSDVSLHSLVTQCCSLPR